MRDTRPKKKYNIQAFSIDCLCIEEKPIKVRKHFGTCELFVKHKNAVSEEMHSFLCYQVTDEIGLSNYFLQDLKNLAAAAENIFKKVQNKLEE